MCSLVMSISSGYKHDVIKYSTDTLPDFLESINFVKFSNFLAVHNYIQYT